jgi:hypothetical protein
MNEQNASHATEILADKEKVLMDATSWRGRLVEGATSHSSSWVPWPKRGTHDSDSKTPTNPTNQR